MARKDIGTGWDRSQRNAINDNFIELYKEYTDAGLNAADAREKATRAVADSAIAKDTAETTREEMLAIIREQTQNGDLAPEIAQARGGEATIGERFNSTDQRLAEVPTEIEDAVEPKANKIYVDAELGKRAYENDLEVERERINNLVAHSGETDGNAELLDIRVGFDGTIHNTAGDAVRAIAAFMTEENEEWVI